MTPFFIALFTAKNTIYGSTATIYGSTATIYGSKIYF